MKQLQPVIWMKGTFLSPQHLQTQDRFLENTLRFQLESLAFQPWGFSELQINHEALAAGDFSITSASRHLSRTGSSSISPIPTARRIPSRSPSSSIRTNRKSASISASRITGIADSTFDVRA